MKTPAQKTAKPGTDLVVLSRTGTDLDALVTGLSEAQQQIETATRDREAAEASYREQILDASPAELEKIQATKARATVDFDRAEALVAALNRRIAIVRDDRERDERRAQHANAVAKCTAIRQRLPAEYRRHALALRILLRDLAEAETARMQAEPLAAEFGWIPSVEAELRNLDRAPEVIVDEEEVMLWAIDGRREPLAAEKQAEVQSTGRSNKGLFYTGQAGRVAGSGHPFECTRRRFTRTRYRAAIEAPWNAVSLLNAVHLPAFLSYGEDFVTAEQLRSADTALAHLDRELPDAGERDRPVLERFEMVDDTPRDGGPAEAMQYLRSVA